MPLSIDPFDARLAGSIENVFGPTESVRNRQSSRWLSRNAWRYEAASAPGASCLFLLAACGRSGAQTFASNMQFRAVPPHRGQLRRLHVSCVCRSGVTDHFIEDAP